MISIHWFQSPARRHLIAWVRRLGLVHDLAMASSFVLLGILTGLAVSGGEPSDAEVYGHTVLPILEAKCIACHHSEHPEGELDLSSFASVVLEGASGPALHPGDPEKSHLVERIRSGDMPPDGEEPLTHEELATIQQWIRTASLPDADALAQQRAMNVHQRAGELWSFQPLGTTTPPAVQHHERVRTPIDRFILARLKSLDATYAAEADRRTLIRRVTFNLTGLPPTPQQIDAFLRDDSPQAWDRLIDRLLASPQYGERWGRHWLDVAGWAESSLLIGDAVHPDFWRYRDWVIRAFNADMPYDQFVREQLAGDEMVAWRDADEFDQRTIDKLTATGFLRCTPDGTDNQPITQEEKIYAAQQTAVEVATKALLGLTVNCVRCHDHKYDPVTQHEYYQRIAIFQPAYDPSQWIPGMVNGFGEHSRRLRCSGRTTIASRTAGLVGCRIHPLGVVKRFVTRRSPLPANLMWPCWERQCRRSNRLTGPFLRPLTIWGATAEVSI